MSTGSLGVDDERRTRLLENGHVAIWLVKDFCWCSGFRALGVSMAIPTVGLAAYLVYRTRRELRDLTHNLAVLLWLCANTTWMVGEFWFSDTTRPTAKVFFVAGLIALCLFYLWALGNRTSDLKEET